MERRGFLRGVPAACAAPAFVRSSVLMPVRSIFVPAASIARSGNTLLSAALVAKEALRIFEGCLLFSESVNRDYEQQWASNPNGRVVIRRPMGVVKTLDTT